MRSIAAGRLQNEKPLATPKGSRKAGEPAASSLPPITRAGRHMPVGLAAAALTLLLVPRTPARIGHRSELDLAGALTVTAGLVTVVYAMDGAAANGWGSARTLGLLGVSAALLAAFVAIERSVKGPLVPPATWRLRSLVSSAAVMLGASGILIGSFFLNSLYLQDVLNASALETGLAFLPFALVIGLAAHLGSHALQHAGPRASSSVGSHSRLAARCCWRWRRSGRATPRTSYPASS